MAAARGDRHALARRASRQEKVALSERDLDPRRGSVLVRHGKSGRRREVGADAWGWEHLRPWLSGRVEMPVGPLFWVIDGPAVGDPGQQPQSLPSFAVGDAGRRRLAARAASWRPRRIDGRS
jgi:hypothetical protein